MGVTSKRAIALSVPVFVGLLALILVQPALADEPMPTYTTSSMETAATSEDEAIDIKSASVSGIASKTWTGKAITQKPTVKLAGKTLKAGTDYTLSYQNNVKVGKASVTIKGKGTYTGSISKSFKIVAATPHVRYRAHRQDRGWEGWRRDGQVAGVTGKHKRLEALIVNVTATGLTGNVQYRTHRQEAGWEKGWRSAGQISGTTGKNKRLEAVQIRLTGQLAQQYDIYYRVHAQGFGWMGWAKNGASAGSNGYTWRIEALQIRLVKKGGKAPGSTKGTFAYKKSVGEIIRLIRGTKSSGYAKINTKWSWNTASGKRLQNAINKLKNRGKKLSIIMIDLKTGQGVAYNAGTKIYSASSIKGPYVAAINRYRLSAVGKGTRATMRQTITVSSNEGYASLRRRFGAYPMAKLQKTVGGCLFGAGSWYAPMNGKDLTKMWASTYSYFYESQNSNSVWCRNLYKNPSMSFIHSALKSKYTTHTKPGWINSSLVARNDAGIVMAGGHPYLITVMSNAYGYDGSLKEIVRALDAVHSDMVK